MISDDELASMQATLAETRTNSAEIKRRTDEVDAGGGADTDFVTIATVSCRLGPQGMQPWEQLDKVEGKVVSTSVWTIALPAGTDIRAQDRIAIGELTYSVIGLKGPRTLELERSIQAVIVQ